MIKSNNINKNDINNVNKSETYKSIAVNKENEEDFVNFSDISLDKDEGETNYNDENFIYNNEETLENVYFKLKTIYGDRKYNIKQEAILENNMKKVYKYIPISKIDVMVTNHSRNDKIKDKLRDAMPIVKYIYSKEFKDYDNQKYEEIDHLQKQLLEKEPFKIIYEEDIFYEIYYMKEENRYILLICTEDIVFKEIQYMLQKKAEYYISRKEEYIYAGIVNLEYSENFLYKEEIEELEESNRNEPHLRKAHKALAREVITFLHGKEAYDEALEISEMLFSGHIENLTYEQVKACFNGVESIDTDEDLQILNALVKAGAASSNREARQFVKGGSVLVNGVKITDEKFLVSKKNAYGHKATVIRRGKKKYFVINHK